MNQQHKDVQRPVERPPIKGAESHWPEYEPPQVMTFRGEEILETMGPAQACSFNHSVLLC
jgi:hypothetical protein